MQPWSQGHKYIMQPSCAKGSPGDSLQRGKQLTDWQLLWDCHLLSKEMIPCCLRLLISDLCLYIYAVANMDNAVVICCIGDAGSFGAICHSACAVWHCVASVSVRQLSGVVCLVRLYMLTGAQLWLVPHNVMCVWLCTLRGSSSRAGLGSHGRMHTWIHTHQPWCTCRWQTSTEECNWATSCLVQWSSRLQPLTVCNVSWCTSWVSIPVQTFQQTFALCSLLKLIAHDHSLIWWACSFYVCRLMLLLIEGAASLRHWMQLNFS